jgi:tetratricopeptide (TPR) repeat protein
VLRQLLALSIVAASAAPVHAESRWTMVRSGSLLVIGDESASRLRDVAIELEEFRAVVGGLIHNADRPPSLPTVVYVFGTRKAMQPYLPLYNGKPATIAGFFHRDQDMNSIVMSQEGFAESAEIAYHEYTHLLIGNAVRFVPVWLNEGLAEYYSTYSLNAGGKEALIGRPPRGRLALLRERSLPISDVIAVDHSSALYNESSRRSIFYAEAWAMTHYALTQLPQGGAAINRYNTEFAEGRTPPDAFLTAFGSTPAEFDKTLQAYTQRSIYRATRFLFKNKLTASPPSPPRTLSAAEANAWLGDLQRRIGRDAEAAPRIEGALAADPEIGVTHLAAGLLRLAQSRTSEGLLELERAAALAPDDFLSQYLYGAWLLRSTAPESSKQSVNAAVAALTRATKLMPESSDAFAFLAYAQMQNPVLLNAAIVSIAHAIELAPGRADYRLRWADIRFMQGANDDARKVLTEIAAVRSDPSAVADARQRLDRLNEYERRVSMRSAANAGGRSSQSIEVPGEFASSSADRDRVRLALRTMKAGEERVLGTLTAVECGPGGAQFRVATREGTILTTAAPMERVELISYLDDKQFTLTCGVRSRPDLVYLTFVPAARSSSAGEGVAVAVEFLPKNYTP